MVQHESQMQLHRIKSFMFSKVGWVVATEWGNTSYREKWLLGNDTIVQKET